MKKKNIVVLSITIIVLLVVIVSATYAYFVSTTGTVASNTNLNVVTAGTARVFDAHGGAFHLEVTAENMNQANAANQVIATAEENIVVNFKSGSNGVDETCTYDIEFVWDSNDKYTAHSFENANGLKEFTLQATLNGANATEGTNLIHNERDISEVVGSTNPKTLISGASIQNASESTTTTATWHVVAKFYNLSTNQKELANKRYAGKLKITNVDCGDTLAKKVPLVFGRSVDMSGTDDTANSNPWEIVNDHGIRYVGQNPDNYVSFNGELWRIIGIFNEKYDTNNDGIPDAEGDLIKIIRNDSLGSMSWDYKRNTVGSSTSNNGSGDWSDSQLMMMLNPSTFLNSGYVTEGGTATHNYTIDNDGYVLDDHETPIKIFKNMGSYFDSTKTAYKPYVTYTYGYGKNNSGNDITPESTSNVLAPNTFNPLGSTAQGMIATVKWYLMGINSSTTTVSSWYNNERNGRIYTGEGTRPKIWYGKVGLMYPSDYGYATNGNPNNANYTRSKCLENDLDSSNWGSGDGQTYCAYNSWLKYINATSSNSGIRTTTQWTITPYPNASVVFRLNSDGYIDHEFAYVGGSAIRPVLYLKSNIKLGSGSGTSNSPFTLQIN